MQRELDGTTSINVSENVMAMVTKTTANDISSRLIGKAIEREENEDFSLSMVGTWRER